MRQPSSRCAPPGIATITFAALATAGVVAGVAFASAPRAMAPQSTIRAHRIAPDHSPYLTPGTRVRQSSLGVRVFTGARDGFALASVYNRGGTTYPAATTDGGRTWRIDGPHFHIDAADAPDGVSQVGVGRRGMYFAYAPFGNAVDVTSDGGRHWWRAYLPGPEAVVYAPISPGELVAFDQGHPTTVYTSKDGGCTWKLSHSADS